jgi:hypothetical protein
MELKYFVTAFHASISQLWLGFGRLLSALCGAIISINLFYHSYLREAIPNNIYIQKSSFIMPKICLDYIENWLF